MTRIQCSLKLLMGVESNIRHCSSVPGGEHIKNLPILRKVTVKQWPIEPAVAALFADHKGPVLKVHGSSARCVSSPSLPSSPLLIPAFTSRPT